MAWSFVPPTAGGWTETAKATGAGLGVSTAIFAPVAAIVMARYQAQLTASLEELKAGTALELERLKTALATGLEVRKALVAGRIRAFDSMLTAGHFFYYVLRQMAFEEVSDHAALMEEADRRSAEASSVAWHLSREDRARWYKVYQGCFSLAKHLSRAQPDERRKIFDAGVPELGRYLDDLEKAGLEAFARGDRFDRMQQADGDA